MIETVLSATEPFRWAWRPKAGQGQIDAGLQAQSQVRWLLQEDGWRLTWRLQLQFRGNTPAAAPMGQRAALPTGED